MSKVDQLLKRVDFYEKVASTKPEANTLLDKAIVFERLALYSDRKSFLEALGQAPPPAGGDAQVKAAVDALNSALQTWISTSAEKQDDIPGRMRGLPPGVRGPSSNLTQAAKYQSFDIDVLRQLYSSAAELAAVNKNLRNESDDVRRSWLNTVFPAAQRLMDVTGSQIKALDEWRQNMPPGDSGGSTGDNVLQVPEVTVEGRPPARGLPPIKREDQQALARFVMGEGLTFVDPAKMNDGQLGPETRKALEAVKDYFAKAHPQNPRMTDQQAITAAKFNK
jgi:hypothetical protein